MVIVGIVGIWFVQICDEPQKCRPRLPGIEFIINKAVQNSTRKTPFEVNYGFHPNDTADNIMGEHSNVRSVEE